MKIFFKIAIFIVILLIGIGALAFYWTFYRPLPSRNTSVELPQLHQPVQIKWDDYGVPHIYAGNKHDLYLALGYVHAQDRLWQMTISQLAARGRFAEFFGKDLVPVDKFERTIGFWRIAKKMQEQLSDSTRRILQAYATGVNQYVKKHPNDLPVQFSLAGMKPIPWSVTYSLAKARLMAWQLNIAWKAELTYNLIHKKLSARQFNTLFANQYVTVAVPDSVPADSTAPSDSTLSASIQPLLDVAQTYSSSTGSRGTHSGSNAWAVSGNKTTTQKPLLAGDPHLTLHIPGQWYEVHLHSKGRNLSGATLPGAPSVVLGQNDVLAWSFTNMMLDDTDFFEEKVDPGDASRYLIDSLAGQAVYQKFGLQHEVIKVKNGDDQFFTRKLTDHGPVISQIYRRQKTIGDRVISMKWTGQQPSNEIEALQTMDWAQNMQQFKKGIKNFKSPAQNIIYADTAGNIGLFTAARVPIRSGNPILLRPGWKPDRDWHGSIAYSDLPKTINPQKGWVANANNPAAGPGFSHYLSVYWQPDSRYKRIKQYLANNKRLSSKAFQVMQNDTYSSYAQSVTQIILPVIKSEPDSAFATASNYLSNWNYTYSTSETAASIMDVFMLRLSRNTFADEMGADIYSDFIGYSAKPARILLRLLKNGSSFFDDIATPERETKAGIIRKSMHQALTYLKNRFGSNPADWRWSNLHTINLRPRFFGRAARDSSASSIVKLIVNNVFSKGSYPAGGNGMTINNGEYLWNEPFHMVVGPSIRRIIDLSNTQKSLSIMPGGQSENPLSSYYNDQTESWLDGQYKYLVQDSSRLHHYKMMRLMPAK